MKILLIIIFLFIYSSFTLSQFLTTQVANNGVWAITNGKQIIQYDIEFIPGGWLPNEQVLVYQFIKIPEWIQLITVDNKTKLYIQTFDNLCGGITTSGCIYEATVVNKLIQEFIIMPNGSSITRVSGTTHGKFTTPDGIQHNGTYGRIFFETNPTIDSITQMTPGELIIELLPE